jgi:outer membrane receptor for ferrienterochelin and colicins
MKKLLLSILLAVALTSFSQNTGSISGKVTDKQTNEALAGATIAIKGSLTSAITNNEGKFIFKKINAGRALLEISYVGYETIEITADIADGGSTAINVALTLDDRVGSEIVVSASKRPEKITNAPASIHVIGVKDLGQFAGSNIGELIAKVQGVEYTRNGVADITFNARGFHSAFNNKILQLVDGRISTTALSGNLPIMSRGTMVKDDIERFEIVLGPQSALYGPNALNAVFNTITKDPRKYQGTSVSISAGNQYQFSGRIRQATKINNKWAYKLTGEYSVGKEYNFFDSVYVTKYPPYDSSVAEHNVDFDFRHIRGEANIYYSITPKTDIIISGGGSNNNWVQVTTGGRNQMRGLTYSFLQARLVHARYFVNIYNTWGNIGSSYPISAYTRDFWNRTHRPNNPLRPEIAEDSALQNFQFKEKSQRLNADAQYNYDFKKAGMFLVAGLNYQKEKPNGFGRNLVDKNKRIYITQYGGVLQLEKKLAWNIRLISAVRYDHHSNFGDFFSPKLGLVKNIFDGSFRITWAKAYAMPTILHQYSSLQNNNFGNGEGITYVLNGSVFTDPAAVKSTVPLKPEEVNTWEFGYKGTIAKKLFVDVNYYNGRSKNFLGTSKTVFGRILLVGDVEVAQFNSGIVGPDGVLRNAQFTTYFNYSNVKAHGVDAGLTYSVNKFISIAIKYSWFDSDITKNDIKNDANGDGYVSLEETSLNAPNNRGLVALNLQNLCKQKMFVNISARVLQQYDFFSGSQNGTGAGKGSRGRVLWKDSNGQTRYYNKNFDWGSLGGFATVDLSAGYKFNNMLNLNMGITNLFNIKQLEFVGSPFIGRLISVELKVHVPNSNKQQ